MTFDKTTARCDQDIYQHAFDEPQRTRDGHLKHINQDGSRFHVLRWTLGKGRECSEPECELNHRRNKQEETKWPTEVPRPCLSPRHNPPMFMVIRPFTTYTHVCPACGKVTTLRGSRTI